MKKLLDQFAKALVGLPTFKRFGGWVGGEHCGGMGRVSHGFSFAVGLAGLAYEPEN